MRLKKWLILSHLAVVITPIVSSLLLYMLILTYNKKVQFTEYMNAVAKFKYYEEKLGNYKIYTEADMENKDTAVDYQDKDDVKINLYNGSGQEIHAPDENSDYTKSREEIYSHLYEIVTKYNLYSLKKPVFYRGELVGFYEIIIYRGDFIKQINIRTIIIAGMFAAIILLVFLTVIILLNRKFNRPIKLLIEGMNDFAEGGKKSVKYKSKDEIGELIRNFNGMKKDIERKQEVIDFQRKTKQYMISAVSHDLKTPLTSIRAYAESIYNERDLDMPKIKSRSSIILNKSDYMKKMIDDLMLYTVLTSDYKVNFVEVWGNEFFEMLFSGYEQNCEKRSIKLEVDTDADYTIKVDVKQMTRVIDNLMANALKYTPQNGRIWLGAFSLEKGLPPWIKKDFQKDIISWREKGCIVVVKNDGNGIPENERKKIFMPFYQVDKARNKTSQNEVGLGLSIVKLVIKKHCGEIKLFSDENSTAFVCWFPIYSKGED
ncbi:MAG: HAMP domain-containing histidine kinase [Clostridium sp.]|uniref:sensor histidine kinase n=1 Tax=Clostridium sp. TaxID=1506 RepID=UPI0025C088E6|nr:HAMP domain-containing sensor histidine kinase [Clostridium sp.]MCH3965167.1 HAMP domain-containing histidine kinase [Clostridium sp.]MCI1714388.1 HAMP domain-containing histidine kinase [Clostridium sp.]MCI1798650.1 HAMP domain-containing histidine kinase [Clostridium sp.]MCI1812619.1 HAMP domain-containing histidine kinase [Clostridium sp.]MCI1869459.1 HAMP domain-containing histidine kinase [Clostridium sp.]